MKINTAKKQMLEGKFAIGAEACLGSPLAAEIFSLAGFDFIVIDQQHGFWTETDIFHAFSNSCLGSSIPMVRIGENSYSNIGRMLDGGALGVIIPMTNTADEARQAAFAVRYPPRGGRSFGPFGVASYGSDYAERVNDEVFLAVQIETQQGLDNVEEILSVEGVDACWVGLTDLGKSMGVNFKVKEGYGNRDAALSRILEACRNTGKIPGISTGHFSDARQFIEQGFLFVTAGYDDGYVAQGAEEALRELGRI